MELYYKDLSPPARAVYATIKHLGLTVTLREVDLMNLETRGAEFVKLNPTHLIPVLIDDGEAMSESRAIMAYLVNQYSPNHSIYPTDPKIRVKIDRILYFEGINLFPLVRQIVRRRIDQKVPYAYCPKSSLEDDLQTLRNALNELIALKGSNKFMVRNEATLADISVAMSYTIFKFLLPEEAKTLETWYNDVEAAVPAVKEINDSLDFEKINEMLNE